MIVVTGGDGFIGQNLVNELTRRGAIGVISLDTKNETLDSIFSWLINHAKEIDCIYHLGAITDTTVMDRNLFDEYNVAASIFIWNLCAEYKIPLVYASSAATYGDGKEGFDDERDILLHRQNIGRSHIININEVTKLFSVSIIWTMGCK